LLEAQEKARLEAARLAKEQADLLFKQSQEKAKQEAQKLAADNALHEAQEKVRLEAARLAKEKAEQAARAAAQQARLEGERLAKEKLAREAEAIAMRNAEANRIAKEAQEKARLEQERLTREKIELLNQQTQEQERIIRDRAEKILREAAAHAMKELESIGNGNSFTPVRETAAAENPDISKKAASESSGISEFAKPANGQPDKEPQKAQPAVSVQPVQKQALSLETAVIEPVTDVTVKQPEPPGDVPISESYTGILAEVDMNLKIAGAPPKGKPVPFHTTLWEKQKTQTDRLPPGVVTDLIEAYTDINLANTMVGVLIETDMGDREMQADYIRLCQKIALRLAKILK
jgi:hypothetical protein